MPEPTLNAVHINRPLTNLSVAIFNDPNEFLGPFIFPPVAVQKWSDSYFIYNQADFLRNDVQRRAPGGLYPEVGYGLSTGSYSLAEYALATDVPDEIRDNSDDPLSPDADAITLLTQKFLIASELRAREAAFNTTNITNNKTLSGGGNYQWTDYANSSPITDIYAARKIIRRATLRKPNRMAMGETVWEDALINHPEFIERIKYTERSTPNRIRAAMQELFMVDEIRTSGAIYNSANKGATAVYGDIWGDDVLLFYSSPTFSLRMPSFAYNLTLGAQGPVITTKRDDLRDRDVHRGKHICQEKIITDSAAYLFKDAVA